MQFHNSVGISVESFLVLLDAYLKNTFITFDNHLFLQKKSIGIGSCGPPVLFDVLLSELDENIGMPCELLDLIANHFCGISQGGGKGN